VQFVVLYAPIRLLKQASLIFSLACQGDRN